MYIIIMILLLSLLILVHEAGHFLAAKLFKIKVSKFGFGLPIGPTLWEGKVGDVQVLVHAFLLGGYVAFPDDEDGEVALPKDSPERFMNRPLYQRLIVVSAGVLANVLCAFVLVFLTAAILGHLPSGKYQLYATGIDTSANPSIEYSGIQPGDQIIEINSTPIYSEIELIAYGQYNRALDGKADRTHVGQTYDKLKKLNPYFREYETIPANVKIKLPKVGPEPEIKLTKDQRTGLERYKDNQVKLNEKQLELRDKARKKKVLISDGTFSLDDLAHALSDTWHPVTITVERNGEIIDLKPVYPSKIGKIGVKYEVKEVNMPTNTLDTMIKGTNKFISDNTSMLLYGFKQILTGKVPMNDLHGVILITKIGGDKIHHEGIFSGLLLTAIISLDLAIVNFLPIPALDGGHVLFMLIEKFRGKPVDEKLLEKFGKIGFTLLILLIIYVLFNDISALIAQKF